LDNRETEEARLEILSSGLVPVLHTLTASNLMPKEIDLVQREIQEIRECSGSLQGRGAAGFEHGGMRPHGS
jgi:hypothetical protein